MESNQNKIEPPNDVDAHVMGSHGDDGSSGAQEQAKPQRLVHGDQREDDVEAHVLPDDLAGIQPPRDLDIER